MSASAPPLSHFAHSTGSTNFLACADTRRFFAVRITRPGGQVEYSVRLGTSTVGVLVDMLDDERNAASRVHVAALRRLVITPQVAA